jgi:putative Mg2+ transporter-C (MgtC) family protein
MQEVLTWLGEQMESLTTLSIIVRFLLAVLIGGSIGINRGRKRRPAGFKTHVLVCMGATMVMMTGQFITQELLQNGDIARLGAQVISGIGFLGAGTIIVTRKNQITGLTTAAGLWFSACVGLTIGIGFYKGALIAWIFMMIVMTWSKQIERSVYGKSKLVELYVELEDGSHLGEIISFVKHKPCKVVNLEVTKIEGSLLTGVSLFITLLLDSNQEHEKIIEAIGKQEGVRFLEEL